MKLHRLKRRFVLGLAAVAFVAITSSLWWILKNTLDPQAHESGVEAAAPLTSVDNSAAPKPDEAHLVQSLPNELRTRAETAAIRDTAPTQIKSLYKDGPYSHERLVSTALELERNLSSCILKDLCGQKPDAEHAYFAPDRTPAHRLLQHALEVLRIASQDNPALVRDLSHTEILKNLEITNGDIQSALIDIYLSQPLNESDYDELLAHAPTLVNEARAQLFLAVQAPERTSPARRPRYIEALTDAFQHDDNATNHLVQRLGELELSEGEFRQVTTPLCRYQDSPATRQNWLQAKHFIENALQTRGYQISIDQLCAKP